MRPLSSNCAGSYAKDSGQAVSRLGGGRDTQWHLRRDAVARHSGEQRAQAVRWATCGAIPLIGWSRHACPWSTPAPADHRGRQIGQGARHPRGVVSGRKRFLAGGGLCRGSSQAPGVLRQHGQKARSSLDRGWTPQTEGPAHIVSGARRDEAWRRIVSQSPGYQAYQDKTDRQIPVIRLTPAAGIPYDGRNPDKGLAAPPVSQRRSLRESLTVKTPAMAFHFARRCLGQRVHPNPAPSALSDDRRINHAKFLHAH
jgi:hypothetical protein